MHWPPAGVDWYYSDDAVAIAHGDCREILPTLPKTDLVLTDPPYASGARRDAEKKVRGSMLRSMENKDWFSHDAMTNWGMQWFLRSTIHKMQGNLSRGAHIYLFTDWRMTPTVYGMCEACGLRVNQCLVWAKTHFGMGRYWRNQHENIVFASNGTPRDMAHRDRGSVLTHSVVNPQKRLHPTEKPVDLMAEIIRTAGGDDVLDPFMGSGPVLRAAKDCGRKAIGIELDEKYCEIAAKRCCQEVLDLR